jgi:hypothetical protein
MSGETAHDHTLIEDMHIDFPIEDYREEPKRKIFESVVLKAPIYTYVAGSTCQDPARCTRFP